MLGLTKRILEKLRRHKRDTLEDAVFDTQARSHEPNLRIHR